MQYLPLLLVYIALFTPVIHTSDYSESYTTDASFFLSYIQLFYLRFHDNDCI